MSLWATKTDARATWSSAPVDDDLLDHLLNVSQEVCEAYAPALDEWDDVPARYKEAVVQQAREVYEAGKRDGDVLGFGDGYAVRVRPLSASVKALLRPKTGVPVVG